MGLEDTRLYVVLYEIQLTAIKKLCTFIIITNDIVKDPQYFYDAVRLRSLEDLLTAVESVSDLFTYWIPFFCKVLYKIGIFKIAS